jgi:hypothetical protein
MCRPASLPGRRCFDSAPRSLRVTFPHARATHRGVAGQAATLRRLRGRGKPGPEGLDEVVGVLVR